jgi:hypothetical protein
LTLGESRSWFPLKGKSSLTFLDSSGILTIFSIRVIDTTEIAMNPKCGTSYQYDFITTSLYLNLNKTDSISFTLSSSNWLCMTSYSNSNIDMSICNIFGETKEGIFAKNLSDYPIGNIVYHQAILILHEPGNSNSIDSIFIANNHGIVGFKYLGRQYTLK